MQLQEVNDRQDFDVYMYIFVCLQLVRCTTECCKLMRTSIARIARSSFLVRVPPCSCREPVLCATGPRRELLVRRTGSDHLGVAVGFKQDLCCMIEDWATTGSSVNNTKVDYLCKCILPLVLCHAGIPPGADIWEGKVVLSRMRIECLCCSAIPSSSQEIQHIVTAAAGTPPPILVEREVCRQCHHRRDAQIVCSRCPGIRAPKTGEASKTTTIGTADWGIESVLIWDLKDVITGWLQLPEFVSGLFNHLRPSDMKHRSLDAERAKYWRQFLQEQCSGDPRALLLTSHNDGFNPLRSRPNDFSLTYGIVQAIMGPEVRTPTFYQPA